MVHIKDVENLSKRIVEEFRPQRVVLFGSYASGNPDPDSDVDLLVVMPLDTKPAHKSVEMRMRLRPSFPLDLLVRTPQYIQERLEMGDSFVREILESGRTLYEADHR